MDTILLQYNQVREHVLDSSPSPTPQSRPVQSWMKDDFPDPVTPITAMYKFSMLFNNIRGITIEGVILGRDTHS